jgi:hypothetical protein
MLAVALLFAGFVSTLVVETVAVFETRPGVAGSVTTSAMVAEAPLATVPREHVTVGFPLQLPWLGVAETSDDPAGMVSMTVTPLAEPEPLLVAVMV